MLSAAVKFEWLSRQSAKCGREVISWLRSFSAMPLVLVTQLDRSQVQRATSRTENVGLAGVAGPVSLP